MKKQEAEMMEEKPGKWGAGAEGESLTPRLIDRYGSLKKRRVKVKMSPWLPGRVFGYLWPASSVHVGADGVVRACSTHIQVGPVPRLDQADEVSTFTLRGEQNKTPAGLKKKKEKKKKISDHENAVKQKGLHNT